MNAIDRNNALFVADAIRQIFGINSPIYIPWGKNVPYEAGEYPDIHFLPEDYIDDEIVTSEFGTPIFGPVTFEAGEYNTYNRTTGAVEKVTMDGLTLPSSCIVDFSRDANITKTDVLGNSGTVKELFGKSDWNITIRGIALASRDSSGLTAQEQTDQLVEWDNICDSIPVLGSIFRAKGINNIVIENLTIQPVVGRWNAIPFQISAVSDEPIELYLL